METVRGFRWAGLAVLACVVTVTGCRESGCETQEKRDLDHVALPVQHCSVAGYACRLVAGTSGKVVNVKLSYDARHITDKRSVDFDWGALANVGSWEYRVLLLYLNNAALEFMNSGKVPSEVTITSIEIEDKGDPNKKDKDWFFAFSGQAFYDPVTLSLREDNVVIRVTNVPEEKEPRWIPFTSASYRAWWKAVDARLTLSELFAAEPDRRD